jgi:hypothetical protein
MPRGDSGQCAVSRDILEPVTKGARRIRDAMPRDQHVLDGGSRIQGAEAHLFAHGGTGEQEFPDEHAGEERGIRFTATRGLGRGHGGTARDYGEIPVQRPYDRSQV